MEDNDYTDPATRSGEDPQRAIAPADLGVRPALRRWTEDDDLVMSDARDEGPLANLQDHVTDLLNVRSLDDLSARVRANPLGTMAVAAGVGYMLQRTHLMGGLLGAALDAGRSRQPDDLTPAEERLLAWLNDAYAMEKAQLDVLENHAEDARRHPHVRAKDLEHLEQTREHVKLVKRCIHELGAKPSKVKGMMGSLAGAAGSMATEPFDDDVVRNFLQDYAAENLEIASYRALIAAAEEAGHDRIARICAGILEEEEAMAGWLKQNLPGIVRDTFRDVATN
ncbi:MAG TPA: ferritin-like domain-containing protein [Longimicrobiales bacterium]|nr:ferritin-like domain-containing protein [Longimicrobiales bacterium]